MRFQSYFNTALTLISQYNGEVPLAHYLRKYFAEHKKHGSKDRKWITHLCYSYYRLGQALKEIGREERLKIAVFLTNDQPGDWSLLFDKHWLALWDADVLQRIDIVTSFHPDFSGTDIFPWTNELSEGVDWEDFSVSHLVQPDLYLRIRPGMEKITTQKLHDAQVHFTKAGNDCLVLSNASKVDTVLDIDRDVVVQDKNSQRVGELMKLVNEGFHAAPVTVWDCCAASGGKSILAKDILGKIELTASDVRPSIIQNLKKRFERAGITKYETFVADLSDTRPQTRNYKLIIVDAPCTGSGTWGRTPEQLYFFKKEKIAEYAGLQRKILRNVIVDLLPGQYVLYITCSVFKEENEEAVKLMKEYSLELVKMELLTGYPEKADTMFAALFKK